MIIYAKYKEKCLKSVTIICHKIEIKHFFGDENLQTFSSFFSFKNKIMSLSRGIEEDFL